MTEQLQSHVCSLVSCSGLREKNAGRRSEITQVFLMSKIPKSALFKSASGKIEVVTFFNTVWDS